MTENIIEERGIFWSLEAEIPGGCYAPDDFAHGTFIVQKDGVALIELDCNLNKNERFGLFSEKTASIIGLLKKTNRSIYLHNAQRINPVHKTHNLDTEDYRASHCLVSYRSAPTLKSALHKLCKSKSYLGNYEEWLFRPAIEIEENNDLYIAKFTKAPSCVYNIDGYRCIINYEIIGPWPGIASKKISIQQSSNVEFISSANFEIEKAAKLHRDFHDFLILLTNQQAEFEWPILSDENGDIMCTLYYYNLNDYKKEFEYFRIWISFPDIQAEFGNALNKWFRLCNPPNPAIYQYLATRRGLFSYSENKFMMLIGGMESFHRHFFKTDSNNPLQTKAEKVIDIINSSSQANSSLKRWVASKMKHAHELSLEQRIREILETVPVQLSCKEIVRFSKICADARNDLAHFGKLIRSIEENEIYQKMFDLSQALDYIYHILILLEIGFSAKRIETMLDTGREATLFKMTLKAAGLSILERKVESQNQTPQGITLAPLPKAPSP